ncbi:hypothetical protein CRV08_05545 [Halarcobacter ebronensis]|uniref:TonB C-terminal domain-containing protein n=1 Tax=Halarcobacter ebronensis TaxID=1462615 RepID=A0A4Q0YJ34_9BACT|nr:TonB family protein [Halarcobacter ebronensis]QKF80998.1 energy transduction protein TonB [Halarcobacter ebronensis]RXJ68901.1 hypothetical protein CRV08_05545 [Halarcobacter ebronensis]RXK06312.1 hypothetical protein CRV07_06335 [Halarcobacter ebronensis]
MRLFYSFILAIFISVSIFFGMQQMISANNNLQTKNEKPIVLNYLREQKDINVEKEKRVKPKEPVKKIEPKKLDIVKTDMEKINKDVKIKPLTLARNIDLSAISSLNGAQIAVNSGLFDANSLQTLSRINPVYPRKAKIRQKEGFVQLQFHISKEGQVSEVVVLKSEPEGFFEDSSINAIKKWRFKPSDSAKDATITFNFRLAK